MKLLISIIALIMSSGCVLSNTPKGEVSSFLEEYRRNDVETINELDNYLSTQNLDDEEYKDIRTVYIRQYSNLKYKIIDSKINNNKAIVNAEINVFDYNKTLSEVSNYYFDNQELFKNKSGDVDFRKYQKYKIKELLLCDYRVDYELEISLTKGKDGWEVDTLSLDNLSKIHGVYKNEKNN